MKTNEGWMNYVGELRVPKQKEGESDADYKDRAKKTKVISVSRDFAVKEGTIIRLQKFEEYLEGRLSSGTLDEEKYKERLKRKDFVKYVMHITPQKEEVDIEPEKGWTNNALEIRKRDEGTFYIKVKKDFAVAKNTFIPLKKASENLKELLDRNIIDKETYESTLSKIKIKDEDGNLTNNFWLIYNGSIPPCKD